MKLLFDENISYRIVKRLAKTFPQSSHVKFHNLEKASDIEVWEFAKKESYSIITNDTDYNDFSLVWGFPPKIIWLRIGNTSTNGIVNRLIKEKEQIQNFLDEENNGILIFD